MSKSIKTPKEVDVERMNSNPDAFHVGIENRKYT